MRSVTILPHELVDLCGGLLAKTGEHFLRIIYKNGEDTFAQREISVNRNDRLELIDFK